MYFVTFYVLWLFFTSLLYNLTFLLIYGLQKKNIDYFVFWYIYLVLYLLDRVKYTV